MPSIGTLTAVCSGVGAAGEPVLQLVAITSMSNPTINPLIQELAFINPSDKLAVTQGITSIQVVSISSSGHSTRKAH